MDDGVGLTALSVQSTPLGSMRLGLGASHRAGRRSSVPPTCRFHCSLASSRSGRLGRGIGQTCMLLLTSITLSSRLPRYPGKALTIPLLISFEFDQDTDATFGPRVSRHGLQSDSAGAWARSGCFMRLSVGILTLCS